MALPAKNSRNLYKNTWSTIEEIDKVFLITWNPKPTFYSYSKFTENDYNMQWRSMLNVLLECNRCCSNYAFVPEISDEGKLHMHGWFILSDKVKYNKSFLPSLKRNGFVKIAKANSHKWKVFKYHVKDLDVSHQYLSQFNDIMVTPFTIKAMRKDLHLRIAMVQTDKIKKDIVKRNVMQMFGFEHFLEENINGIYI